jgi:site-specific DNA-methyltransferase (adenine-specific)
MCGSGTTLVAAKNLGRSYLGIDQSPLAVRIATKRLT